MQRLFLTLLLAVSLIASGLSAGSAHAAAADLAGSQPVAADITSLPRSAAKLMQSTPKIAIDENSDYVGPPDEFTSSTSADLDIDRENATSSMKPQYRISENGQPFGPWIDCGADTAWKDCDSESWIRLEFDNLTDGTKVVEVRLVNLDGSTINNAIGDSFTWSVDTVDPNTTFLTTPPAYTNADSSFTFSFTDSTPSSGLKKYQCRLNSNSNTDWSDCSTPKGYALASLLQGNNTLHVRAVDKANNTDTSAASHTWFVDKTKPTVSISAPTDGTTETSSANVSFTFTGTDNQAGAGNESGVNGFECTITTPSGPEPTTVCSSPFTFSPGTRPEGTYTFKVVSIDRAGNKSDPGATKTVIIDKTAPETTLNRSGLPASTSNQTIQFTFSGNDSQSSQITFVCQVDGGSWDPCSSPEQVQVTVDGNHTFRVAAQDKAGNVDVSPEEHTWLVDANPPILDITFPSESTIFTNRSELTIRYSATDVSTLQFTCTLNGVVENCNGGEKHYSNLPEQQNTLVVTVRDQANNEDSETITIHADYTEPQTTLTGVQASPSNNPRPNFAFTGSDTRSATNNLRFECSIDLLDWVPCQSGIAPPEFGSLASGLHTFQVRAIDEVGNFDTTPATFIWRIDVDVPNTTLNRNQNEVPPAFSASTSATFNFSGVDTLPGAVSFECQIDNGSWNPCSSPRVFTNLVNKLYTFQVRARDQAGNVDPSPELYSWTVDTIPPPSPSITSPISGTLAKSLSVVFTGTDSGPGTTRFQCIVSTNSAENTWQDCTSPHGPENLPDGTYWLKVRMVDQAGNASTPSSTRRVILDKTPPDTSVTVDIGAPAGFPSFTRETTAIFTFSATKSRPEENSTFICALDGQAPAACNSPRTYPGLSAGRHTFTVYATDDAGNSEVGGPEVITWTVDTQFPTTVLVPQMPPEYRNEVRPTIQFRGEDLEEALGVPGSGVVAFDCDLDGQPISPCAPADPSGNGSFTPGVPLADGPHVLKLFAIDAVGHKDTTPTVYTWTQDTVVPDTTNLVRTPPDGVSTNQVFTLTFDFSGTEAVAPTFECKLDGADWISCASPFVTPALDNGAHTFQVRVKDAAGNVDGTPLTDSWVVDRAGPVITINDRPNTATNLSTAAFTFSADDNGGSGFASAECRIDNEAWQACSTLSISFSDLAEGDHTFHVRATDQLGNVGAAITYSWTVDQTAPDTAMTGDLPAVINVQNITLHFTGIDALTAAGLKFECSLDNGPFESCVNPRTFPGLTNGDHNLRVRAIDGAGNIDQTPATHQWKVEVANPIQQIHLPLVKK